MNMLNKRNNSTFAQVYGCSCYASCTECVDTGVAVDNIYSAQMLEVYNDTGILPNS